MLTASSATCSAEAAARESRIISLWTRIWCLRQLLPFTNTLLGITGGAIDPWPLQGLLGWWHWHVRLPLVVVTMLWPSLFFAFIAHVCNLVFLVCTMPFVWDHMIWASLHEVAFVCAIVAGRFGGKPWHFLAAARIQTIISYFCAAFWKLNTSFLDSRYSCATILMAELLSIIPGPLFTPNGRPADVMLRAAPILTVVLEFAIPLLLAGCPHFGVLLGLAFHLTILMLPVNAAGGFSIMCATSYFFFVPQGIVLASARLNKSLVNAGALGAATAIAFAGLQGTKDAFFAFYVLVSILFACAICLERQHGLSRADAASESFSGCKLQIFVACLTMSHGLLGPMFGLQQMGSLTMYGNVKHWSGSNHLMIPTGLLQEIFAEEHAKSAVGTAFAGGIIRVDTSDLPAILLRTPADAANLQPVRVHELLQGVVGNRVIFHVPYYARMAANDFFDNVDNSSAADAQPRVNWHRQPFVVPAFELRRLLVLARQREEPFMLRYTVLPREARTPAQWVQHTGPQVYVQEDPRRGFTLCAVNGVMPCASDEVALLSAPPRWLASLLLQYPVPLVGVNDTELHCIS